MMTIESIFEAFGGTKRFAKAIGVSPQAASNMKARGNVPSGYWDDLVTAAQARARILETITHQELARVAKARASLRKNKKAGEPGRKTND